MPVRDAKHPIVIGYADAILQNAAVENFQAAEGLLGAAWEDLRKAKSPEIAGNLLLTLALYSIKLPGRPGDILSVGLIEFVRDLGKSKDIRFEAAACKIFADGIEDQISTLPLSSFAASSVKLTFLAAQIVIALANDDLEKAADMARFIDESSNARFKFWALVQQAPPPHAEDELKALFTNAPDPLECYKEASAQAFMKKDFERTCRLSDVFLRLHPTSLGAATNKALALLMQKKYELALPAYDYAIALAPQDPFIWNSWMQRAEAAWVLGKRGRIMESLMAVHKINPQELRRLLTRDTPQGAAFNGFLQDTAKDPAHKQDAQMLLSTYYGA